METTPRSCIDCGTAGCNRGKGPFPEFCLTENLDPEELRAALALYEEEENHTLLLAAAVTECEGYHIPRIQEIGRFAQRIGCRRVGIATCVGLINEARLIARHLRLMGLEVYGVGCKVGMVPKHELGLPLECEECGEYSCNPILQATLLNRIGTQLNVVVGLCVGHDSLFYKYSDAPVTTAITKDRVLSHNPAGALYTGYYKSQLFPGQ